MLCFEDHNVFYVKILKLSGSFDSSLSSGWKAYDITDVEQ